MDLNRLFCKLHYPSKGGKSSKSLCHINNSLIFYLLFWIDKKTLTYFSKIQDISVFGSYYAFCCWKQKLWKAITFCQMRNLLAISKTTKNILIQTFLKSFINKYFLHFLRKNIATLSISNDLSTLLQLLVIFNFAN